MSWGQHRRRAPGYSWFRFLIVWGISRGFVWWYFRLFYRLRRSGLENLPRSGPIIYVANHASHLDPPLVGCVVDDRPPAFMARDTLFKFKPFGALIRFYGSIPIVRGGRGAEAMRTALTELAEGRCILIFPEGTRSRDGSIGVMKAGFLLLVRKSKATVVPVGTDGCFDAWPRTRSRPRLFGRIHVHIGEPIEAAELKALGSDGAVERVRDAIQAAVDEAKRQRC